MGSRPMPSLALHLNLQLAGRSGETSPADPDDARREIGDHMDTKQGLQTIGRSSVSHPDSSLRQLLGGLKQQPHTTRQVRGGGA